MSKKILNRKQRVLLENSQILLQFPLLQELLSSYEELSEDILPHLDGSTQSFLQNMMPNILLQAESEWDPDFHCAKDLGDDRVPCSLCGTANRYVFYITNRLNATKMNVGSDCIQQFGILCSNHYLPTLGTFI